MEGGGLDERHPPPLREPPLALPLRGCLGIALPLGGLVLGGDWGRGLLIACTVTTVWGAELFAREALAHWRSQCRSRRRRARRLAHSVALRSF